MAIKGPSACQAQPDNREHTPPDGEPQRSARETNKNDSLETNDKAWTKKKKKGSIKLVRNTTADHGSSTGLDKKQEQVITVFTHTGDFSPSPSLLFLDFLYFCII